MKIMVIDSSGMVGHVVSLFLKEQKHEVFSCNDLSEVTLRRSIEDCHFEAVINCSAVINQDAEKNKAYAVYVNAFLPHFLEQITSGTNTVVVHRSTDCIFSGKKGKYNLEDWPDATNFYARTKAVGELDNSKDITIRTSLIGPETDCSGASLLNWYVQQSGTVNGYANSIWTGLTTLEFAKEIEILLLERAHGVFQLVPNYAISKYELLCLFEKYFPCERQVKRIENKLVDKSLLPILHESSLTVPDYDSMVYELKSWIVKNKVFFPDYYFN